MIIVWGSIETTVEHLDRVLDLSLQHVRRSREEPGCIAHRAHVDAENGQRIVFFEQWRDLAALRAHFAVPESREFAASISRLATSAPEIRLYQATKTTL